MARGVDDAVAYPSSQVPRSYHVSAFVGFMRCKSYNTELILLAGDVLAPNVA